MVNYEVTVSTGNLACATTFNDVFVKLVGTDGESKRTWIKGTISFTHGTLICCPVSIGKLVLIELDKQCLPLFPEDAWFPAKVVVKSPEGATYNFPIYRWITDSKVHLFREATALRVFEDNNDLGRSSRQKALDQRKKDYCWDVYAEGIPHCMKTTDPLSLPCEVRFSFTKDTEFRYTAATALAELQLKGLADCKENWTNIDDINRVFCCKRTDISDYVQGHWKEDAFFGYQYLNGLNPMLIRRCSALPDNFPVTDDMVFRHGQGSLRNEMENGNLFLCDYKLLDGVKANTVNGKKQYLMAPLVLLRITPDDKLMPIAIQLKQTPADDNPIFFPTDSMALLRNVPMVHPLYKLLIPHTRYTLQINYLARSLLISKTGVFTRFAAPGGEGVMTILERSLSSVTYSSLCIPEDIAELRGVLSFYYKNDAEVQKDSELQKWISDIFEHGFLSQTGTGIPQSFTTVAELVKFVTMVIFTCSGQHSAVNNGQYDYGGWMPNTPISLQLPPPTTKGKTSKATMLQTFPSVNTTVQGMATVWLLSSQSSDFVPLGQYPEDHFSEKIPCKLIKAFQGELEVLSADIKARNKRLEVPYTYMDPKKLENSVAI
ncbi:hypothetical protein PFLUV_G00186870 [Perca fluviatilis]|uniref:Lipoxygenase domain-containing protein n=1 Tax=Perca fluviatilis TaxID=8168 RepID=A0A6A5DUK7_PERFL|nr:hypothetical protein PFLUV_G00186870 [Perca fluviatilis]